MISCVIDAMENWDVATVDIPSAFMQADMDKVMHMKLEAKLVDLLISLSPNNYMRYVTEERGKKILYVKLRKALYGTLHAALLFWRRLTDELVTFGFEVIRLVCSEQKYQWIAIHNLVAC
jgi:hypothetical protein